MNRHGRNYGWPGLTRWGPVLFVWMGLCVFLIAGAATARESGAREGTGSAAVASVVSAPGATAATAGSDRSDRPNRSAQSDTSERSAPSGQPAASAEPGSGAGNPASPATANTMCPVLTDETVDPDIVPVEYKGLAIGFCCNKCRRKFLAHPEDYAANLPSGARVAPAENVVVNDRPEKPVAAKPPAGQTAEPVAAALGEKAAPVEGATQGGKPGAETSENAGATQAATKSSGDTGDEGDKDAKALSESEKAFEFIGKFHVLVVHFPIALLLGAALAELIGLVSTGAFWRDAGWYCAFLGALGAVVAAGLGWIDAVFNNDQGLPTVLALHRWLGTSTAVVAIAAVAAHVVSTRRHRPDLRNLYRVLLFLAALLVGVTGHFGGTLIYGLHYFSP